MENVEVEVRDINEIGDINCFRYAVGLLIAAAAEYVGGKYILDDYVVAWMLVYAAYFFAFFGVVFLIFGIVGELLGGKSDKN